jgi:hypothetical protein
VVDVTDRLPRLTGCPRGCPPHRNDPPCLVSEPIPVVFDFAESAVWVSLDGAVALTSLREQATVADTRPGIT